MHNIQMQVADDTLLICVAVPPVDPAGRPSIVASTRGNVPVEGRPDLKLALIVYSAANGQEPRPNGRGVERFLRWRQPR